MAVWTRRAGLFTELEVSHLSSDSRLRPDLVVMNGSETLIIDATVVNPLNKSNMNRVQNNKSNGNSSSSSSSDADVMNTNMVATDAVEEAKKKKYAKLTSENHGRFVTAAMESTGGMGKEFRELIDFVCLVSQDENGGWSVDEVRNGIRGAAAIAIQVGNARIIMESRQRLAKRAVEWDRRVQRMHMARVGTECVGAMAA